MPNSASSIGSNSTTGRLGTGNSFGRHGTSSHRSHLSRRSPSPTDHYRDLQANNVRLHDRLYELNKFIYQGIDKFLDKQAVRDLIQSYDDEDLYPEGGLEGPEFLRTNSSESDDSSEEMLTVVQENNKTVQIKQDVIDKISRSRNNNKAKERNVRGSIMDTFMAIVRFKIFNVKRTAANRRDLNDLAIFNDDDGQVTCFC